MALELRPEVAAFAQAMERKLREHDDTRGHRGWSSAQPDWIMVRLAEEVGELAKAVRLRRRAAALDEAADVGNLAMMVADVLGALARQGVST